MDIRQAIFEIIQPDNGRSLASRCFDGFITALILASVVSVFVVTFDLPAVICRMLAKFECAASIVFTIEYGLRILTADKLYPKASGIGARVRFICSTMAIIDLLAILPFWLPMLLPGSMLGMRALRLVRLLRILKLNRYFDAMQSLGRVVVSKKRELIGSMFFVALLMLVSSLLMYAVEHDAQPDVFTNAFSGLWWSIATLTTVGYGDIYPITVLGRILGALIALLGIAALAIPTGIITSGLMERAENSDEGKASENDDVRSIVIAQQKLLEDMSAQMAEIRERIQAIHSQDGNDGINLATQ